MDEYLRDKLQDKILDIINNTTDLDKDSEVGEQLSWDITNLIYRLGWHPQCECLKLPTKQEFVEKCLGTGYGEVYDWLQYREEPPHGGTDSKGNDAKIEN
ncbi:hypothetical protein [Candidatus Magnetobacterium casense]|uniref:Uncharacterized protein n=1 Tax=Candidatus Magnetobacterium casense TaxID=1455061 RepID=A0ABS6RZM1_9BACT|nr:hypothetical protein [Candidatus Magnetobacterium casensis]MBV6341478.1 hypothetical protein [Candidatus Magnetobacterium casensis]